MICNREFNNHVQKMGATLHTWRRIPISSVGVLRSTPFVSEPAR